jgi:hypothetical protein
MICHWFEKTGKEDQPENPGLYVKDLFSVLIQENLPFIRKIQVREARRPT